MIFPAQILIWKTSFDLHPSLVDNQWMCFWLDLDHSKFSRVRIYVEDDDLNAKMSWGTEAIAIVCTIHYIGEQIITNHIVFICFTLGTNYMYFIRLASPKEKNMSKSWFPTGFPSLWKGVVNLKTKGLHKVNTIFILSSSNYMRNRDRPWNVCLFTSELPGNSSSILPEYIW